VLGCIVLPTQFALARANEAFDDAGALRDPAQQKLVSAVVSELADVLTRLRT
jgi:hypothetical protein